jgi:hypothetical protein
MYIYTCVSLSLSLSLSLCVCVCVCMCIYICKVIAKPADTRHISEMFFAIYIMIKLKYDDNDSNEPRLAVHCN